MVKSRIPWKFHRSQASNFHLSLAPAAPAAPAVAAGAWSDPISRSVAISGTLSWDV